MSSSLPQSRPKPRWPLIGACAWIGVVVAAASVGVSTLWHDRLTPCGSGLLCAHYLAFFAQTFRYHAAIALGLAAAVALLSRRRRLALLASIFMAIGFIPDLSLLVPRIRRPHSGSSLRIMSVNLMYGRTDIDALMKVVDASSPDLIVFQEWTPGVSGPLRERLARRWPAHVEHAREDAFGQAVFSSQEFARPPRIFPPVGSWTEPQITVELNLAGRAVRVTNAHILPPISQDYFKHQREMARWLAEWGSGDDGPGVFIGDFNAVRGSGIISAFERTGFTDAHHAASSWRGSTWPRIGSLKWLPGVQLDHALVGRGLRAVTAGTCEDVGSDHRPIIVDIAWEVP